MEWSNETIFHFIALYENEAALWDTNCPKHKNRNEQHDAWVRIKSELKVGEISIKDLKKKRDCLMATYRKLRAKVKQSIKTGTGANEIYKPEWPFYNAMSTFLDGVFTPRKTKNSEEPEDEETEIDYEETETLIENENTENMQDNKGVEKTFKTPKHPAKRTKILKVEENMEEAFKYFKQLSQKPEPDECSLYAELLSKKLRGLQEKTREIAMLEIDKLLFQLKQNETQNQSSCFSQTQTPSSTSQFDYQHFYQFIQPFHHSAIHNAYHPYNLPQSSPNVQMYNHLQKSPTSHPWPSLRLSSPSQPSPFPQPPSPFNPSTSSQLSSAYYPSPFPQPPSPFHPSPSPQSLSTFQSSSSSQPSPTFHPSPSPQQSPNFHAAPSPQQSSTFHTAASPQPSPLFHTAPASQSSPDVYNNSQQSPTFNTSLSPHPSATFHPSFSPQPLPHSLDSSPASKNSLKEYHELEVQNMFK